MIKYFDLYSPFIMGLGLILIIVGFSINEAITAIIGTSLVIFIFGAWILKGIIYIFVKIKNIDKDGN